MKKQQVQTIRGYVLAVSMIIAVLGFSGCLSSSGSSGGGGAVTKAPSDLILSAANQSILAGGSTEVYAAVRDSDDNPLSNASVSFRVASDDTSLGSITLTATTDGDGVATATFTSTGMSGSATIEASVGDLEKTIEITMNPVVSLITLSTDKINVITSGNDSATITANLLDASSVPIEGQAVSFSTTGGSVSAAGVVTDAAGNASISLSSGANKTNGIVTVTATAQGQSETISINLIGSEVALSLGQSSLTIGEVTVLEATVFDGAGQQQPNAELTIAQSGTGSVNITPAGPYQTGSNGTFTWNVEGVTAGDIDLAVTALGDTATASVLVSANPFAFTSPAENTIAMATETTQDLTVYNPDGTDVILAATMGHFDAVVTGAAAGFTTGDEQVTVTPAANIVTVTYNSGISAGTASVRAQDATDGSINDNLYINIAAPPDDAYKVDLQLSSAVADPNGDTVQLDATVRSATDVIVGNAPVYFSLFRTTGGGEYVDPGVALTGTDGVATSTFVSGAQVTDNNGVFVMAKLLGATAAGPDNRFSFAGSVISRGDGGDFGTDGFADGQLIKVYGSDYNDGLYTVSGAPGATLTVAETFTTEAAGAVIAIVDKYKANAEAIKITNVPASVALGVPTEMEELNSATYRSPMSVLVADSSGHGIGGVTVSLEVWPTYYATGIPDEFLINYEGPVRTAAFPNQDLNRNQDLDPEEAVSAYTFEVPALYDDEFYLESMFSFGVSYSASPYYYGQYFVYQEGYAPDLYVGGTEPIPANSVAGSVPTTVVTDENGVAEFYHDYLKMYAGYVKVEMKATVQVQPGSQTQSKLEYWLPWLEEDAQYLGASPWGGGQPIW